MKYFNLKFLTFFLTALLAFGVGWAETKTVTLSNANIVAAGTGKTGYANWTMTDGNSNTWSAYAIKNQHSNATSAYHYLQIRKLNGSTAYYIQVPQLGAKITQIVMTVSGVNQAMTQGQNSATLFFSNSNSTSAAGDGVASGTGDASVTIDCSSLNLNTGYITTSLAVRIWDVTVTYEENTTPSTDPTITVGSSKLDINQDGGSFTVTGRNLIDNIGVTPSTGFSTDCDPKPNGYETWGFANNGGSVDGTVTVNYTGRPLNATGTVTMGTKPYVGAPDSEDITEVVNVNFQYDGDIYILGNFGNQGWNYNDASHQMTPNNGTYTARFTVPANSWLIFSKQLSENGLWNESYFGAPDGNDGGNWEVKTDRLGNDYSIPSDNCYCLYISTEGEYVFTVDATTNKFKVEMVEPMGETCPAVIEFKDSETEATSSFANYASFLEAVSAGSGYINSADWGDKVYQGNTGLKFSSSKANGSLTINLKDLSSGSWRANKIIVNAKSWTNNNGDPDDDAGFTINGSDKFSTTTEFADYELTVDDATALTSITIAATKRIYVKSITIMHECGDEPILEQVAIPTFSPVAGTYTEVQNVAITSATEGATIYYTTDGTTEPTTESAVYSEPIAVGANMTIKAIAVKEGMDNSAVATAEYIINLPPEAETIAAAQAMDENTVFNFTGNAVVTFHNSSYLYIRDASGSGLIYGVSASDKKYENGDVLTPGWKAKYEMFREYTPEFTGPSGVASTVNNGAVEPIALTTIALADVNKYAKIDNVTITGNNGNNYYYKVDDTEYCLRRAYTGLVGELTVGKRYNVTGVVTIFRSGSSPDYTYTPQLNLISAELIKEDVTLTFEPASVSLYVGETFTAPELKGLPEGATVTYSSSNAEVATVTDNVVAITGTPGTATITATFAGNEYYNPTTATYTITVKAKEPVTLSFGENPDVVLTIGETFTAPELTGAPEGATVTYESSNTAVATVDENGNVTIVGVGTAKITASYAGNSQYNPATASYTITVNDVVVALAAPTFSPKAGTYTEPKEVAIACATPGVTIEYTIDGVTKTYDGPFTVDHSCTVTATAKMGTRTVYTPATAEAQYTINAAAAAEIADNYYYLQNNELSEKYANVAGRRTLNFVDNPADKAGTVFRVETGEGGAVKTLRSQAVDLQGYAKRAMAYVGPVVQMVINKLNDMSDVDDATGAGNILGHEGLEKIMEKFNECFDYNLYVEGTEGAYRIYARTPSMQHVVDFYNDPENNAQIKAKLPDLEGYINQVLDKIRAKVVSAGMNGEVIEEFSLEKVWEKMGGTLIKPVKGDNAAIMAFYDQVLTNKEYVWDFAYQTAMIYLDNIKETNFYKQNVPAEYQAYIDKMQRIRPETKYYMIQYGNEPDYVSENNVKIINGDASTYWTLTPRVNFTVNVPEANKLNDSYYTTLYTDFAYNVPDGVTAYAVTGIDANDVAQLAELSSPIAAQTPVLLKANAAGTVNVTLTTAAGTTPETNLLEGPDYLVKTFGITSPTVEMLFSLAAGFVPADMLAEYEYLKLRTSGTVNNKYMWALSKEEVYKCGTPNEYDQVTETVIRRLATSDGTLAFSDQFNTETNKAFMVSDTKPVIYLEKETLAEPTFSPVPGSYTAAQQVEITAEDGATISYSTDGGKIWNTYEGPITVSDDMTIVAKAEKTGMIASNEVTAVYVIDIPTDLPDVPAMKGYYQIKNNGNNQYAHVQGRKTLTFTDAPADKAGTVIWLETDGKGKVLSLRSQAADLQRYADRAMSYVPEIVELVAEKLNADGEGLILGHEGLEKIMEKFNESFDHHLYVEQADGGYRIYGKTPSMQPVVEFYRENQAKVEAKLPMLEDFINSALTKLRNKLGGQSVFTEFKLHDIWHAMGETLTEPTDDASTMAFYREVLNNKNYVWDFAYQTAMIYVNNLKQNQHWAEVEEYLGEFAQYINKIEQIRPDFKYYIAQKNNKPDFISEGNVDVNEARNIWTLEERTKFNVKIDNNVFGCPYADGIGGYATTLYTDFAYSVPDGVTAYKVTSIKDGKATVKPLSGIIPAQTPVLLTAKEAGVKELMLTTDAGTADMSGNLLYGPDYLINEYDINTTQVQDLFDKIKEKLGQDFYDTYVAQYEHLADLNSGTVNNKYFWSLKQEDVAKCGTTNEYDQVQCVVRSLEGGKFVNNMKVETNKAFLVNSEFDPITINSLRGDVNHDGAVNIQDVTDLIDRLLENNFVACPYCSDFNEDTAVNIQDVTDLIDHLLKNPESTEVEPETGD